MVEFLWWDAIGQDYARFTQKRTTNKHIPYKIVNLANINQPQKRQQTQHKKLDGNIPPLSCLVQVLCVEPDWSRFDSYHVSLVSSCRHLIFSGAWICCELCLAKAAWQERVKIRLPNWILTPLNSDRATRYSYWNFTLYRLDTGSTCIVEGMQNLIMIILSCMWPYVYVFAIQDLFCDSFCDRCQLTCVDVRFQESACLGGNDAKCSPLLPRDKFQARRECLCFFCESHCLLCRRLACVLVGQCHHCQSCKISRTFFGRLCHLRRGFFFQEQNVKGECDGLWTCQQQGGMWVFLLLEWICLVLAIALLQIALVRSQQFFWL